MAAIDEEDQEKSYCCLKPKKPKVGELYDVLRANSEYSSIPGLVFIFMSDLYWAGRMFWFVIVVSMICLGFYWSWSLFMDWQQNQVLTTVSTTALPVTQVPFPAVTICSEGYDMELVDMALFTLFFEFVKHTSGLNYSIPAMEAAKVNLKLQLDPLMKELTLQEKKTYAAIIAIQENYWLKFINEYFSGMTNFEMPFITFLDWMLLLLNGNYDQTTSLTAVTLSQSCNYTALTETNDCLLSFLNKNIPLKYYNILQNMKVIVKSSNFSSSFKEIFSILWHGKLPCYDTLETRPSLNSIDRAILKKCTWKGVDVPCAAIFKKFPTDQGLCCTFNQKAAEDIFLETDYLDAILQKQNNDENLSIDKTSLPSFYEKLNETNTQAGRRMGLQLILDAHTNVLEAYSVRSVFQGFTALITNPGSYLLTDLKGFQLRPGQNNMVALSALMIGADDGLHSINPVDRSCIFSDEIKFIKLFKTYSQENCIFECSFFYAQELLKVEENLTNLCTPWYFPFFDNNYIICNPFQNFRISQIMQNEVPSDTCNYCLPDCVRTIYRQSVTTQPFRRCDERNMEVTPMCSFLNKDYINPPIWGQQVLNSSYATSSTLPGFLTNITSNIRTVKKSYQLYNLFEKTENHYDAFAEDIAVLNVFFDTTTVMLFQTQSTQTWVSYLSNVGGSLGLCIGLSIMTIAELVWVLLRMCRQCFERITTES